MTAFFHFRGPVGHHLAPDVWRRGCAIVAFIVSGQISPRPAGSNVNRKREWMESMKHHRLKLVKQL